jgi:pyruvate kinase
MPQKRNTKIVATIGPASNSKEMIAELFEAGVNMFRLNFSHGTHDDHKAALEHIRALEKKTGQAHRGARRSAGTEAAPRCI